MYNHSCYREQTWETKRKRNTNNGRLFLLLIVCLLIGVAALMRVTVGSELLTYNHIEITVKPGDTLWNIARDCADVKTDTRKMVDYICKLNELRNPLIYPGQKLLVPVKPESL